MKIISLSRKVFLLILTLSASFSCWAQNGYEIKLKIKGLNESSITLAACNGKFGSFTPIDTIKVNARGEGVFSGKQMLPAGIYVILPSDNVFFDFILDKDQKFLIEDDMANLFENLHFVGSKDNQAYFEYLKFMTACNEQIAKEEEVKSRNAGHLELQMEIDKKIELLREKMKNYTSLLIINHPDSFLSVYLQATQEVEIPDTPKDSNGNITNPYFQYFYYRHHYFDHFNIADSRLLRTSIYEDKIIDYLTKVTPQIPDTVNREIDFVLSKAKANKEVYKYLLETLLKHYRHGTSLGYEAAYLYIADRYYIKDATWADADFMDELKRTVPSRIKLSLGHKAPDIELMAVGQQHFKDGAKDSETKRNLNIGKRFKLSDVNNTFTILYFWSGDCDHCRVSTPIMYKVFEEFKDRKVNVIAIHILNDQQGKEEWVDFINQHGLYDWTNAWNPEDFSYKTTYNLQGTPTIYLLDKHQKIVAKNIGPEKCGEVIRKFLASGM